MPAYFSSAPVFMPPSGSIDAEKGIIHGVVIARTGPVRGHNGMIDQVFLSQLCAMAQLRPQGIKARFGHPNMCSTALGTYLGRFKNYSLHENFVKADLYLDATSKSTPNGNLFEYILNMAEKNPDMLGASIVFEAAEFELDPLVPDGPKIFRLKELRATDIVDDPAANDSLFSADSLPAQASVFLDNNPELADFIFSKPESVIEFLNNYMNNNMNLQPSLKAKFQKLFGVTPSPNPADNSPAAIPDNDLSYSLVIENEELKAGLEESRKQFQQFLSGLEQLKADLNAQVIEANTAKEEAEKLAFEKITSLQQDLSSIKALNADLSDRLAAKPSIPSEVTDPQLSTAVSYEKDQAGKMILQNMPAHVRRKLKDASK